jgi:hypothetical protein
LIFGFFANLALNPLFMYGFLFIPAFGIKGIAVSVDLDETDYAIIEDDSNEISAQDCLKLLGVINEKN